MADDIWTVKRILDWIEGYLSQHGDENPRVSAQWLVSEAIGTSRMQLFMDAQRPLTAEEREVLRGWTRRRGAGEPLQYITGQAAFRHISVKVTPGVLIPRPETEVLVSEALALLPAVEKPQDAAERALLRARDIMEDEGLDFAQAIERAEAEAEAVGQEGSDELLVADICTGTGCIACSIAHEHPLAHVVASDLSPAAVALARDNVAALGLDGRVEVIECDLGEGVDDALLGSFDLVVSNPPYIPTGELASLPAEVTGHEPALALDGGADGLDVFRRLVSWCGRALRPGGAFAFELHESCLDEAAREARAAGFDGLRITYDLAGRPRVLTGKKPA